MLVSKGLSCCVAITQVLLDHVTLGSRGRVGAPDASTHLVVPLSSHWEGNHRLYKCGMLALFCLCINYVESGDRILKLFVVSNGSTLTVSLRVSHNPVGYMRA